MKQGVYATDASMYTDRKIIGWLAFQ